jgi:hypothetical protein
VPAEYLCVALHTTFQQLLQDPLFMHTNPNVSGDTSKDVYGDEYEGKELKHV